MSKRWFLIAIAILLMFALPSFLFALDMPGMPGMGGTSGKGGMVDKIYIQTQTVGKVLFSHRKHGTRCNECHPKLFQKKSNSNHVNMKAMERGRSCGGCHNGNRAFSVTGDCDKCHAGDILFKDEGVGNVTFSHSVHTGMFSCDNCHPDLFKAERGANKATMEKMENGESCGACHDGSSAFSVSEDCGSCHDGGVMVDKINIQTQTVGKVIFSHKIHGTKCNACHPKIFKKKNNSNHASMKEMESGKSCGSCHNGDTAFSVTGDCVTCHAGDILFKEEDAGNVTFSHSVHTGMFSCDNCHPDLFKAERGANKATMEDMEKGKSCGACHDGSTAFSVAEGCESCHQM